MPDDDRLDLSVDLDKIGEDLLADVKKAAEEVKSRRASDKAKEAKSVEKEKTRKLSAVMVAIGVVVVLVIAYFVVFAKTQAPTPTTYSQIRTPAPAIKPPAVTPPASNTKPQTTTPMQPPSRPGANANQPSDDYEQPKGM
jgi:cytoskeletal protein RodZ